MNKTNKTNNSAQTSQPLDASEATPIITTHDRNISIGMMFVMEGPEEFMRNQKHEYICISLSCGNSLSLKAGDVLPSEDIPCPCGDPNHWLVKFEQRITPSAAPHE
jgi:hypothetical protein